MVAFCVSDTQLVTVWAGIVGIGFRREKEKEAYFFALTRASCLEGGYSS